MNAIGRVFQVVQKYSLVAHMLNICCLVTDIAVVVCGKGIRSWFRRVN